ncbi:hypothetical protein [Nostoc sp. CHAB 5715]|uniref:hypothetical protein n=1 Tax=Nostoc sp. CHAB 5715 TaxID=2780400 RepID=UPI001E395058|nr:hypothetical protein [Nostoc sp. CHAB 5715]MCC5620796.1 hypothetical protein [Nostoc sp. CHAB 5715]
MTDYGSGLESRSNREPSPSEAIVESQSVKSAAMVSQAVGTYINLSIPPFSNATLSINLQRNYH